MSSLLDARASVLRRSAADGVDLLVVGGGINGAGVALDAAARGLRTLLLERDDLGVGTSSRSSKLIHGGLRYLEHYEFGLVREALAERSRLRRLAPHLVRLERFLVPLVGPAWEVPYIAAGLTLYDLLGGRRGGWYRYLTPSRARERVPSLKRDGLKGAFAYTDGIVDDARFLLAVAETARRMGAEMVTRTEVGGLLRQGGRVAGAEVRDLLTGEDHEIRAGVVVDATGAYPGPIRDGAEVVRSRGIHLVVPRHLIPASTGMTIRVPERVVFLIPWADRWLIGTTDVPHEGEVDRPTATAEEVDYLLETVRSVLEVDLTAADVLATFAGIRPLAGSDDGDTAAISREERIEEVEPGLVSIRGGKYTTYRLVARRAVDVAAGTAPGSSTEDVHLAGAAPPPALEALPDEIGRRCGLGADQARHLVSRYGADALEVAETAASLGLDSPLVPGLPYLEVEAWWGIHREQALSVDDVLARRTRIAIEDPGHGAAAAGRVADMLGEALGWDGDRRREEAEAYLAGAEAEYGVPGRVERVEARR